MLSGVRILRNKNKEEFAQDKIRFKTQEFEVMKHSGIEANIRAIADLILEMNDEKSDLYEKMAKIDLECERKAIVEFKSLDTTDVAMEDFIAIKNKYMEEYNDIYQAIKYEIEARNIVINYAKKRFIDFVESKIEEGKKEDLQYIITIAMHFLEISNELSEVRTKAKVLRDEARRVEGLNEQLDSSNRKRLEGYLEKQFELMSALDIVPFDLATRAKRVLNNATDKLEQLNAEPESN